MSTLGSMLLKACGVRHSATDGSHMASRIWGGGRGRGRGGSRGAAGRRKARERTGYSERCAGSELSARPLERLWWGLSAKETTGGVKRVVPPAFVRKCGLACMSASKTTTSSAQGMAEGSAPAPCAAHRGIGSRSARLGAWRTRICGCAQLDGQQGEIGSRKKGTGGISQGRSHCAGSC